MNVEIKTTIPTVQEYTYLCESVGWSDVMNFEVAEASLRKSIHCVTVKDKNQVVGMGRTRLNM